MVDRIHALLNFWFGEFGVADLPTSDRTSLWFGENHTVREQITALFNPEFESASKGELDKWAETPRGRLALILLYDQFPRFIHKASAEAFAYDEKAQSLCLEGIEKKMDHSLTLIERVFFYMPLVHAENSEHQEKSIRLFQELATLSMTETQQIYQLFLAYAYAHFKVIKEFHRFPQRNKYLKRESTPAEQAFLKNT